MGTSTEKVDMQMQNKYRCSHIRKAWERAQRRWICRCRTNIGVHILERHGNEHREGGYVDAEHKELKDMTSKFINLSSVSKSSDGSKEVITPLRKFSMHTQIMLKLHKGYIKLKQRKKCTMTKALYIH